MVKEWIEERWVKKKFNNIRKLFFFLRNRKKINYVYINVFPADTRTYCMMVFRNLTSERTTRCP